MIEEQFSHVFFFHFFLFFCKKNKWRLQTTYPKRDVPWRITQKSLFWEASLIFGGLLQWRLHWGCQGLSFVLDLSDQICTLVLLGLTWYGCMFVYLCLLRYCMIFCCVHCLLKAFPNCYNVWHQNKMYAPLSTICGGSNRGSPVFIRFGYLVANSPTHSLKSLNHFLLTVKDKPCRLDQHNVSYITSWEV